MAVHDQKDRYGDKLRQLEDARENQWASERDRVLLAKMRDRADEQTAVKQRQGNSPKVFNRILCPVDFDEDSLAALDLAHYLAVQNDAELDVLHVRTKFSVPSGSELATELESEQLAREKLKEIALKRLATVRYNLLTMTGGAAERVIDAASTLGADLIVMGTRRRRTIPRLLLGSVAERVVREAGCPVLTTQVTEPPTSKVDFFKRILCPIDFEASSLKALDLASLIAVQTGVLIYLLHVCPTVTIPLGGTITNQVMAEELAKRTLEEIAHKHLHNLPYEVLVTSGDVAERIRAVQLGLSVDLIVMGTHGRRAVSSFFMGSVANRALREAWCPVLTVRLTRDTAKSS